MNTPAIERRGAVGLTANGRTLSGYVATFGNEARIGGFSESIAPGAFRDSLATGQDVLALLDHKPDALLGRTKTGTLTLREDSKGLRFDLKLPDTQHGRDLVALAERGDLGGMSFGFIATDEKWTGDKRELRAVDLLEISVVQSWPAYQQTEIQLRHHQQCFVDLNALWMETL